MVVPSGLELAFVIRSLDIETTSFSFSGIIVLHKVHFLAGRVDCVGIGFDSIRLLSTFLVNFEIPYEIESFVGILRTSRICSASSSVGTCFCC